MSKRHLLFGVQSAGLLLVAGGCGTNYDPVHYLNSIKQITRTWTIDADLFGKMIRLEKDPARLQADHRDLTNKINMLVVQSGKIKVPSGREAQELWNAFQTYLKDQQRIVTGDFQELVAIKIGQTGDPDRFRTVLARCKEIEDADLARLHKAEAALELAHGFAPR